MLIVTQVKKRGVKELTGLTIINHDVSTMLSHTQGRMGVVVYIQHMAQAVFKLHLRISVRMPIGTGELLNVF